MAEEKTMNTLIGPYEIVTEKRKHSGWAYVVKREDKIVRINSGFPTELGALEEARKWVENRPPTAIA